MMRIIIHYDGDDDDVNNDDVEGDDEGDKRV